MMAELEKPDATPKARSATLLTAAAKAKAAQAEITLMADYHVQPQVLETLFDRTAHSVTYKPKTRKVRKPRDDSSPPSPPGGGSDSDDYPMPDPVDPWQESPSPEPTGQESAPEAGVGPLVEPPKPRVNNLNIAYAKRATQVDANALRKVIWELMEAARDEVGEAALAAEQPAAAKRGGKDKAPKDNAGGKEVSCQYVLSKLKDKMPAKELAEVSFAYCYICILHLAHDHALDLLGEDNMEDMRVRFPPA